MKEKMGHHSPWYLGEFGQNAKRQENRRKEAQTGGVKRKKK